MTLQTLRDTLYALLFESGASTLSEGRANRYLNDALHHVAAWVAAHNLAYLVAPWSGAVANPSGEWVVPVDLGAVPYPGVLRIVWAGRQVAAGKFQPLDIVGLDAADVLAGVFNATAGPNRPAVTAYNGTVGLLNAPVESTTYMVGYVHALRDMTANADTPGQSGGVGTANKLPELFQPLIPLYAALVALAAEQSDATQLRALYEERRSQLLALLATRQWKR